MATKMNATTAKRVKALNINAKTEEEAREKLLEILAENGIDGMEEEDTDTILDIAESFVDDAKPAEEPEEETATEEDENDDLANEVEEDEEEEETEEGDQFDDMDRTALKAYIKENGLDVVVKKSMTDDDIRDLIRQAEADDEVAEEEKPAPVEKKVEKAAKKVEKKVEKAETGAEKKADKKAEKKEAKKTESKRGVKLDPQHNEEDRKEFEPLKKLFPEDEYLYAWVASAGVTIKYKGKNSQRALVLIENCSKQADGSVKCNLYLLTFTKQTELLDKAEIDYQLCWSGAPMIKGIAFDEAIEIVSGLMELILATVQKIDKKLGENRKKMEENLDKTAKKAKADEEEEKPAKKAKKNK